MLTIRKLMLAIAMAMAIASISFRIVNMDIHFLMSLGHIDCPQAGLPQHCGTIHVEGFIMPCYRRIGNIIVG